MTIKIINWGKNGKGYLLNNIYKKFKFTINGDTITINYNKIKFIINNYHAYNLNESIIQTLLNQKRFGYREFLDQNKKFNEYINNQKYKDGFFMKVIKKFFQSKLAITSIERLFSIEKKEYEQLFKVLSEDIENYIYIMPYYCIYNTERTVKNPMKVIIDPLKEKYCLDIRHIGNDLDLDDALREFCNIAFRKFDFEREILHLTAELLYFLYIDENSLNKEISSDGKINIILDLDSKEASESKNRQRDEGNLFEILCYGKI